NERVFNAIVSNVEFIKDLKYKNEVLDATLISKIVNDKYVLALNDSSHWFSEVKYNRKVSKSEKQGEKNFVNRYFDNNGYLKDDVPMDYLGQIFETLIKWNYLINSTEGGLFYIMKSRYCNLISILSASRGLHHRRLSNLIKLVVRPAS